MTTVRDAAFELFRGARDDDDLRQPGLDRAADARALSRGLPLRARPAGGASPWAWPTASPRRAAASPTSTCTPRPGVGNAVGAIFNAQANKAPLLVTAGQQIRSLITMQANLTNRDAVEVPKPFVKWSHEPPRAADVPFALAQAIHHATSLPPRGPAFVSIPMDDWRAEIEPVDFAQPDRAHRRRPRRSRTPAQIAALAERLARRAAPCSSPARTSTPPAAGMPRSSWSSASACRCGPRPATGGNRIGFPEDHPAFQGVLPPAVGPIARDARRTRPGARRRLLGLPLLPEHPGRPARRRGPSSSRSRATPTRPRARRWATRSSPTWRSTLRALARRCRRCPDRERAAARASPRRRPRTSRPAVAGDGPRDARRACSRTDGIVVLESPSSTLGAAQPAAPVAAGLLLLQRRRRPRLRPLRRRSACSSPSRIARSCACSARVRRSTRSRRSGRPPPTTSPSSSSCCATSEYSILKWFASLESVEGAPGLDLPGLDVAATAASYGVPARHGRPAARSCTRRSRTRSRAGRPAAGAGRVAPGMALV